jgi:chemotaxis protein histidine kinase CheA
VPAGRFVLVVDEVPGVFAFVLRPPGRLLQGHGAVAGMAVTDGGGTVPMLDLARIARPDPQ